MALFVLMLALYVSGLAKWGKSLQAKGVPLRKRRIYGLVVVALTLFMPLLRGGYGGSVFLFAVFCAWAVLGYITLVHTPRWIVGAPKQIGK